LVAEVNALRKRPDVHENLPAIRSVGYRQVWQYLLGNLPYDDMRDKAIAATRQLAKRQMTWLRHWAGVEMFDFGDEKLVEKCFDLLF
jgi:tRNA dimethylallyltransferase